MTLVRTLINQEITRRERGEGERKERGEGGERMEGEGGKGR